jgi:signal transduction histidine kinase
MHCRMLHDRDRMANRRIHAEQVRTALSNLDQHHAGSDIGIESLAAEGAFKLSVRQERADSAVRQASRAIELGDSKMADRIDAIETSVSMTCTEKHGVPTWRWWLTTPSPSASPPPKCRHMRPS